MNNLTLHLPPFMKNKILSFSFLVVLLSLNSADALMQENLFNSVEKEEPKIFIDNRILARVNGKPISTYDLMKKMDLIFYRQYPQYTSSIDARAEFYDMSWKYTLDDIIDKELILADAKENKIEVSSGDVRQEMELSFGPNIIANLDKAGITFEEATKLTQEEIIIKRMIAGRVHSKAVRRVTPSKIKLAYEEFIKNPENARLTQWTYRIITIKERQIEKTEEVAKAAYQFLEEGIAVDQLQQKLKDQKLLSKKGKVTISQLIKHDNKEISKEYREMLEKLEPGMFSQPFVNKSRTQNVTVYRILVMMEKFPGGAASFKEMEPRLKDQLLDKAIEEETDAYVKKLRGHYHITPSDLASFFHSDYRPFLLK